MNDKPKLRTLEHYTTSHHRDTYPAIDETLPQHSCKGRSVFITGAGSGIGKAIALSFARAGASAIYAAARGKAMLEKTKTEALNINAKCDFHTFEMDVVNAAEVEEVFTKVAQLNGKPLDILVSNAGYVAYIAPTSQGSFDSLWNHFEVNVKGSFLVIQEFLKHCVPKGGTIVNISSGAAVINMADGLCCYSASKLALIKILDYVSREEKRRELRIFNLHPGVVPTAMSAAGEQACSDTAELPGSYVIWLCTPDADFLKGRFMYANWDIEELKAQKEQILKENLLTLTLRGMDSTEWMA